ncbi:ulp1 protease family protein [Colletotrichum tofieldiae]|nr:ulp1 protease family protein [Colletotrichum tofieldiae]
MERITAALAALADSTADHIKQQFDELRDAYDDAARKKLLGPDGPEPFVVWQPEFDALVKSQIYPRRLSKILSVDLWRVFFVLGRGALAKRCYDIITTYVSKYDALDALALCRHLRPSDGQNSPSRGRNPSLDRDPILDGEPELAIESIEGNADSEPDSHYVSDHVSGPPLLEECSRGNHKSTQSVPCSHRRGSAETPRRARSQSNVSKASPELGRWASAKRPAGLHFQQVDSLKKKRRITPLPRDLFAAEELQHSALASRESSSFEDADAIAAFPVDGIIDAESGGSSQHSFPIPFAEHLTSRGSVSELPDMQKLPSLFANAADAEPHGTVTVLGSLCSPPAEPPAANESGSGPKAGVGSEPRGDTPSANLYTCAVACDPGQGPKILLPQL